MCSNQCVTVKGLYCDGFSCSGVCCWALTPWVFSELRTRIPEATGPSQWAFMVPLGASASKSAIVLLWT